MLNYIVCILLCLINLIKANNLDERPEFYKSIKEFAKKYERPFTLLEIGAQNGYYSFKVSQKFNCTCVMVESGKEILSLCKEKKPDNIILLNRFLKPNRLKHLSECEHFDIVLALNLKNRVGPNWKDFIDAIIDLGDHIIIDVMNSDQELIEYIKKFNYKEISNPKLKFKKLYLITKNCDNYIKRKTWLRSVIPSSTYKIESSFRSKILIKPKSWNSEVRVSSEWLPGINLCTFKMCHGAYPGYKQLCNALTAAKSFLHTDWLINNMIIQGTSIKLIDGNDILSKCFFSDLLLNAHKELLLIEEPKKVEHYFWNKLTKLPASSRSFIKLYNQLFPSCSLVFYFGDCKTEDIKRYLGYGTKLVFFKKSFKDEEYICTNHEARENIYLDDKFDSIDRLINQYGKPAFFNIDVHPEEVCGIIQQIKTADIPCISFKFYLKYKHQLLNCLMHLKSLGYSKFNFSVREIPSLVLENNKYTKVNKNWVQTIDELINEINEYSKLDFNSLNFWGYIYCK